MVRQRSLMAEVHTLRGNIRVLCRIRPFLPHEGQLRQQPAVVTDNTGL